MLGSLIPWKKKDSGDLKIQQEDHPIACLRHDFDELFDRFWNECQ